MEPTYAIVGANLAGGRAAEALRAGGFSGRVVLIGAEPHPPYERPPLSKEILKGTMSPSDTFVRSAASFADDDIDLRLGTRVIRILPAERSLELENGEHLRADKVLLCTGGRVRRLAVPGVELDGVHYLRTIEDALAIRAHLERQAPVVVVGAGFIGAEVAAAARELGCQVTLLEVADVPLWRVLGTELGARYAQAHRDRGVDVRTGTGISRIEGDGRVRRVVTSDGAEIDAELVVVGVGIEPSVELAELAGIAVGNGIIVDEQCRTSIEGVFAAGDVAYHPNPILGAHVRLEHWQNAQNQGVAAARSMLGETTPFAEVPWVWSDQYDLNLQIAGHPSPDDEMVIRGDLDGLAFCAFFIRDDALAGVVAVNRGRDVRTAMKLIEHRTHVRAEELADEVSDLRKLVTR